MEQAIQVSPTEDDAVNLSKMFSRAAEAIVQASSLPKQVSDLQAQVSDLQSKLDAAQTHSQELDRTLAETRDQRDQARQELASARQAHADHVAGLNTQLNHANDVINQQEGTIASRNREIDAVTAERNDARKERDDHGLHAMEVEDQLKAAQAKLASIQDHFKSVFGGGGAVALPSWGEAKEAVANPVPAQPEPAPAQPESAPADKPWWESPTG